MPVIKPVLIGVPAEHILRSLHRYYLLTAPQLCALRYSPRSLTMVRSTAKQLLDLGYLQRLILPRPQLHGSGTAVYTLARAGLNHLAHQGFDVRGRYRRTELATYSYLHLAHTLAVNDFLIAAEQLCQQYEEFSIASLQHERDLRRSARRVPIGGGQSLAIVPDGWLDLRGPFVGGTQVCISLELDRGTEEQRAFRRKIRGLVTWARAGYREQFGTEALTIAVVATPGPQRVEELLTWTERELQALQAVHEGGTFLFTAGHPQTLTPETLFFAPSWQRPWVDRAAREALLPLHPR